MKHGKHNLDGRRKEKELLVKEKKSGEKKQNKIRRHSFIHSFIQHP